jgi:hypothetical protein
MPLHLRNWLLKQMHARDTLDGVALTVKLAVTQFGTKRVAQELRSWAEYLERKGTVPGWHFPSSADRRRKVVSQGSEALAVRR